jgi:hypothetical protein
MEATVADQLALANMDADRILQEELAKVHPITIFIVKLLVPSQRRIYLGPPKPKPCMEVLYNLP